MVIFCLVSMLRIVLKQNRAVTVLVLNSAVNPFAYAAFKRDLKNEFKGLICTVTSTKHEQRKTHKNIHIAVARTSLF